jgi:hypothetical protein
MKTLFNPADAASLKIRIHALAPDSPRHWGSMTPTQTLAHCSAGLAMALGDINPPRARIGRLLGPVIKRLAVGNEEPMRRNSPTMQEIIITNCKDFAAEQSHLSDEIDRVIAAGPAGCTTHPHAFFGPLTPAEWGNLMHKHLDHHLRQFGV